ncbi:hypothetical protein AB0D67_36610 [Streptosporangium sp. NPDC048047]|uniref:hypothetical protein n=1 Tax=Streptosporangium sp. NPDC048047 TaxID=3155748 RepID=UPI00344077BB
MTTTSFDFPGRWVEGAGLGLCAALVPLGAGVLRDGPAPRWWAYPLVLGVGAAAVLLGMAG